MSLYVSLKCPFYIRVRLFCIRVGLFRISILVSLISLFSKYSNCWPTVGIHVSLTCLFCICIGLFDMSLFALLYVSCTQSLRRKYTNFYMYLLVSRICLFLICVRLMHISLLVSFICFLYAELFIRDTRIFYMYLLVSFVSFFSSEIQGSFVYFCCTSHRALR